LSGDGGDELFGGYWRYLGHDAVASFEKLPAFARAMVNRWIQRGAIVSKSSRRGNRARQLRKLLRGGEGSMLHRHLRWSMLLDERSASILRDGDATDAVMNAAMAAAEQITGHAPVDDLNRVLAFDLRYGLPGDMLHKVDWASMRQSLEVRVPFLDPEVVAVAEGCPAGWKIDRGMRKRLLIDAYRGHVPDAILDRDKMGFELPIGEFFRRELRDLFLDTVTAGRLEGFEIFDPPAVMRLFDDHCARRGEYADLLFALLSLCAWRGGGC
jgi:asparagine synthase (glutamine-hydrolysing)